LCPTTPANTPILPNGCADPKTGVTDEKREDADGDGISDEFDECPDTSLSAKVIDNRGCEVGANTTDPAPVSAVTFGLVGIILLFLAILTLAVMRRRRQEDSIWGSEAIGDALFDSMDLDGDGIISDEEWEIYKKLRDSNLAASTMDDDDIFDD